MTHSWVLLEAMVLQSLMWPQAHPVVFNLQPKSQLGSSFLSDVNKIWLKARSQLGWLIQLTWDLPTCLSVPHRLTFLLVTLFLSFAALDPQPLSYPLRWCVLLFALWIET